MPVHTISSDLHRGNVDRYAVSLARTMTKLRALGMPLMDVVRAVTRNPAVAVGLDRHGFGTIQPGQRACLTVFDELDMPADVEDSTGDQRHAPSRIETRGVVLGDRYYARTQPL